MLGCCVAFIKEMSGVGISAPLKHSRKKLLFQDFQSRFPAGSQSICAVLNTSKEAHDIVFP